MIQKTILVIGAGSSIGVPLVINLLDLGFRVIAQSRSTPSKLFDIKIKNPENLIFFNLDFSNENAEKETIALIELCGNELFSVVHLPSVPPDIHPLSMTSIEDFELHINFQLRSLHLVFQNLNKVMKRSPDFRVVAVNSELSKKDLPPKGLAPYVIAKSVADRYLNCLDSEYRSYGVKVNQILPGMFRSPFINGYPEYVIDDMLGEDNKDGITPEEDLIPLILYLLSHFGRNIYGQKIEVNGINS